MNTNLLTNSTVKKAIDALQATDKTAWFAQFTDHAELFDDGNTMNRKSVGSRTLHHIDKIENGGLVIYGKFHSDQ